jgi:ATP-dependent Zn protease
LNCSWFVPFALLDPLDDGRLHVSATIAYEGALYESTFGVAPNGEIEMLEDDPIGKLEGLSLPTCPELAPPPGFAARAETPTEGQAEDPDEPPSDSGGGGDADDEARTDREVTEAVVEVLLTEAVRDAMDHTLLQRFNRQSTGSGPIPQLCRFLQSSQPIVIIESEIPFIEDIVAGLLNKKASMFADATIARAGASQFDDSQCVVATDRSSVLLHLISFHAYRSLWDAEKTSHQLGIGLASAFIGCSRRRDVPEPLRRVADLVLRIPRIDERLFVEIFSKVFGSSPPTGWDQDGGSWTRYLLHSDFHAPHRLQLDPGEAAAYLRERCTDRLAQVSVKSSVRLEDLHGLGEARQVAEDLIADIAAARKGEIPWSAVDRGLLLVGPPGTGKTTLAQAIAGACEVKFIHASAAQWQSAGHLDVHLRAIRNTFAEARRYAPAILFLDEIDSIGNRELLVGHNASYQTEVINAVLEQVQGMDSEEPVMLIAATNFVDKVDPALRRAGRLDQVVMVPLPSIAGLERIFEYHLKAYRDAGRLAPDVQAKALSQLALGLTGADVEFFVRGAARRARKARRELICQEDLIAEVTRRPRHPTSAVRLGADEMRRTAVHEGGHAIAGLLSVAPYSVNFVSIIPRMDGSLGFVASVLEEGSTLTRRTALERLRMVLAGRAAEELVYGADDMGLGSGGGATSDLAVATRLATNLVCATGFGTDGSLYWTPSPTPAQREQVDILLRSAYEEAVKLLRANRAALERIAAALVEAQELDGDAVRALLATDSTSKDPSAETQ